MKYFYWLIPIICQLKPSEGSKEIISQDALNQFNKYLMDATDYYDTGYYEAYNEQNYDYSKDAENETNLTDLAEVISDENQEDTVDPTFIENDADTVATGKSDNQNLLLDSDPPIKPDKNGKMLTEISKTPNVPLTTEPVSGVIIETTLQHIPTETTVPTTAEYTTQASVETTEKVESVITKTQSTKLTSAETTQSGTPGHPKFPHPKEEKGEPVGKIEDLSPKTENASHVCYFSLGLLFLKLYF